MSYDLHLFAPRAGIDPRAFANEEDGDLARGPRNPKLEALKRKIADALIAHDPRLELFTPDFDEISRLYKIPFAEAQARHRHLELTDTAGTSGIQVTLFDDRAWLTIPFWHKGDAARRVLSQAWAYVGIVCDASGYEVFDPQLDRVIGVSAFDEVLAAYAGATARMETLVGRAPKKPWWKFW